ncbi:MAG: hypothetical protein EAZ53_03180 [Bacteroidetes bacterium]|nr:MAG: hypothetical protein EAZ53_03180 [Bacteroidota bacterium]
MAFGQLDSTFSVLISKNNYLSEFNNRFRCKVTLTSKSIVINSVRDSVVSVIPLDLLTKITRPSFRLNCLKIYQKEKLLLFQFENTAELKKFKNILFSIRKIKYRDNIGMGVTIISTEVIITSIMIFLMF